MGPRDAVELTVLGALWGASFLFMRIAAPEFGPVPLIFVRVGVAALILGTALALRGGLRELRRSALPLAVLGSFNTAIPFSMYAFATLSLSAGLSAVLNAAIPLFGALIAFVWLGQRLHRTAILGVVTGVAGVLVLAWPRLTTEADHTALLAALAANAMYGWAPHYARHHLSGVPPLGVATGSQIAAALLLLPIAIAQWPDASPSPRTWTAALLLAVGCTAIAYVLYFRLIARAGPVIALAVTYLIPVFGVIWGAIVLDERLPVSAFAGGALVLAGVALATRPAPSP